LSKLNIPKTSLTRQIVILIIFGVFLTAWAIINRSEEVLEDALLDQAKVQAQIFMLGIGDSISQADNPLDSEVLKSEMSRAMARDFSAFGFTAYKMYFFDHSGKILAHSEPGAHENKTMKPHYEAIFSRGASYLGKNIEYVKDPKTSELIPTADIIIPLTHKNKVLAALEVEINLAETLLSIKKTDDKHETEMLIVISVSSLIMLVFLAWVINRWILKPIIAISTTTAAIADGALDARVTVTTNNELGALGQSINEMGESLERLFNEQEQAHLQMMQSLAKALEAKDAYTAGHSGRVSKYSVKLGKRIGLSSTELKLLKQGALMHDLGKIGIADAILNKPSQLDEHEYEIMKKHPVMTASIMKPLKRFKEFAEIAAWHHERWDGKGYPDGLKGEEVPLLARIVGIADTWDAMTGDRIYRKGLGIEKSLSILDKEKDSGQWDPGLIREFIAMIRDEHDIRHEVEKDMFSKG